MKVAIDSDRNGTALKMALAGHLAYRGYEISDLDYLSGHNGDYPDVAYHMAEMIRDRQFERGILICGTGLGMAICANKVKGIYAGTCTDVYAAQRLAKSNNAQILTLGARVTGEESAKMVAEAFLGSSFAGGASTEKVERIKELENEGCL